jgi:hypothetical protein
MIKELFNRFISGSASDLQAKIWKITPEQKSAEKDSRLQPLQKTLVIKVENETHLTFIHQVKARIVFLHDGEKSTNCIVNDAEKIKIV